MLAPVISSLDEIYCTGEETFTGKINTYSICFVLTPRSYTCYICYIAVTIGNAIDLEFGELRYVITVENGAVVSIA